MIVIGSVPASAETVMIAGSGSIYEYLRRVSADFTRHTGIQVDNIQNLASAGSMRAVAEGVIDIAVTAQPLTEAQKAEGLKVLLTLETPFVLATSHPAPPSMTIPDVIQAYSMRKSWPDGAPIRVILRPKQSPDVTLMEAFFPGLANAWEAARLRPDIPVSALDPDHATLAETIPGSLAGMAMLQAVSEKRKLYFVPINGIEPSLENFERGLYPYSKPLSFVVRTNAGPAARRFIEFVGSPEGQDIFRRAHRVE